MLELSLFLGPALAVAVIAWAYYAWRVQPMISGLRAGLLTAQAREETATRDLEYVRDALRQTETSLRTETERRAAAEERAARVPELEHELEERERAVSELRARAASLETALAQERRAAQEKLALLDEARVRLTDTFRALSAEALKSNNQSFLQLASATFDKLNERACGDFEARRKAVEQLVTPMRESLAKIDGRIGEIEQARIAAYAALDEQLRGLVQFHLPRLHQETANLVKALRQPAARGRWGELQLRRVVEMAGMLEHCDFIEQDSRATENGQVRPDLVVRLPGGKQIVVDAKAPTAAYLEALEAQDEETRAARLADHARQVRNHIASLSRKAYWEQFDPTPDFVVMFLPGEMFFSAALQSDPSLIEFGVSERVLPASPTTLIAMLRAIAYGWRQEALAKNAQEVAELGKQLHERIGTLAQHWTDVGERLDRAVKAYNRSVGTLERRVLVSARRFKELKAAADDVEIETPQPIERTVRQLQAPEMVEESRETIE